MENNATEDEFQPTATRTDNQVLAYIDPSDPKRIHVQSGFQHRDEIKSLLAVRWVPRKKVWALPLAWSSCLGLRATFGERLVIDPTLTAWAAQQRRETIDPAKQLREAVTLDDIENLTSVTQAVKKVGDTIGLFKHQYAGAAYMATTESCIIGDETGTGKSAQTIAALRAMHSMGKDIFPVLIVAPKAVVRPWEREFNSWWPGLTVLKVEGGAASRRKILETPAHVYIVNWEMLRHHSRLAGYGNTALKRCVECGGLDETITVKQCETHIRELNQRGFKTVIADECFTGDKMISTPSGDRRIDELAVGDIVYGFDHDTGRAMETTVKHVMTRQTNQIIDDLNCTPNHPYWIEGAGYRPAVDITESDIGYALQKDGENMRVVRHALLSEKANAKILLQEMQQYSALRGTGSTRSSIRKHVEELVGSGVKTSTSGGTSHVNEQSVYTPRNTSSYARNEAQERNIPAPISWRERFGSESCRAIAAGEIGTGLGVLSDSGDEPSSGWVSVELQNRSRAEGHHARSGMRRMVAHVGGSSGAGREEGQLFVGPRMDDLEILEPRDFERYRRSCEKSTRDREVTVYNIETGTNNYFAGGVLVHNCHRAKSPQSKQSRALWALGDTAEYRYALTGTPVQDNIDDLWSLYRFVFPDEYTSKTRFIERFANTGFSQWGMFKILGLKEESKEEYDQIMGISLRRMLKKVVLPFLPPIVFEDRYIPMTGAQSKAYKQMEETSAVELGYKNAKAARADKTVDIESGKDSTDSAVATTPLARNVRLLQFASSYAELVKDEEPSDGVTADALSDAEDSFFSGATDDLSSQLVLSPPSNKINAVIDMLESGDFSDESVIFFAQSRQLIDLLSEEMTKKGFDHSIIVGGQDGNVRQQNIDNFQNGETKYILVTISAGGVGLTLTAASTMVFVQRSMSSIGMKQAMSRAHRIGSERHESITVMNLITEGTVEEEQLESLSAKYRRADELLGDTEQLERAGVTTTEGD